MISYFQFAVLTAGGGEFAEAAACAANMAGVNCISVVPKSTCRATLEVSSVTFHTLNHTAELSYATPQYSRNS